MARERKTIRDHDTGELKLATRTGPPRKNTVFRRLEASVPRKEWLAAFEASSDERVQRLYERMLDPAKATCSLAAHAKAVGLAYPEVLKLITQFHVGQGLVRMASHAPQVLEDVAIDSKSTIVPCPMCHGEKVLRATDPKTGGVIGEKPCWSCDGTGKLRKVGDADARKLMFDTLKLTGNRAPLIAQQFVQAGGQTVEDALNEVAAAIDVKPVEPTTP